MQGIIDGQIPAIPALELDDEEPRQIADESDTKDAAEWILTPGQMTSNEILNFV